MRTQPFWFALIAAVAIAGCGSNETAAEPGHEGHNHGPGEGHDHDKPAGNGTAAQPGTLKDLVTRDTKEGKGPVAKKGDLLTVEYIGKLKSGKEFDRNWGGEKAPFSLVLGQGSVIQGWEKGLEGMKVGGEREIEIPYRLGYGDAGAGEDIPPKSDLYFTVKLLDIVPAGKEGEYTFREIKNGTGAAVKAGDKVTIKYKVTLMNGFVHDSSDKHQGTTTFTVGRDPLEMVIGVDDGIRGMKKGGVRELKLPPALFARANPMSGLGPNDTAKVEIELVNINGK